MNKTIAPEDIIGVIRKFCDANEEDEATINILYAVAAELLDVSTDSINEIISSNSACYPSVSGPTLLEQKYRLKQLIK